MMAFRSIAIALLEGLRPHPVLSIASVRCVSEGGILHPESYSSPETLEKCSVMKFTYNRKISRCHEVYQGKRCRSFSSEEKMHNVDFLFLLMLYRGQVAAYSCAGRSLPREI